MIINFIPAIISLASFFQLTSAQNTPPSCLASVSFTSADPYIYSISPGDYAYLGKVPGMRFEGFVKGM